MQSGARGQERSYAPPPCAALLAQLLPPRAALCPLPQASDRWSWEQATESYVQLYNKVSAW